MSGFGTPSDKEQRLFLARLDDLEKRATSGCVSRTPFLTPGEQYRARAYLCTRGSESRLCFFGGYSEAERRRLFILPEYISCCDDETRLAMLSEDFDSAVRAVRIEGSGFCTLSHRDYLGALLALGIERDVLGDICVSDSHSATVICAPEAESYILSTLESIGRDSVRVSRFSEISSIVSAQKYQPLTDTIASARMDCVVAALCGLSRERAQNIVRSALADRNYETVSDVDCGVCEGDIISVRGFGKFVIRDISGVTKKGRIRLVADKYL